MRKYISLLLATILLIGGFFMLNQRKDDSLEEEASNTEELTENIPNRSKLIKKKRSKQTLQLRELPQKFKDSLQFSLKENKETSSQNFSFIVENISNQKLSLHFGTSQRYDYKIYDDNRRQIYHFAEGKNFLQVLEEIELKPKEKLTFDIPLPDLNPGKYTIEVFLVARGTATYATTATFIVEK